MLIISIFIVSGDKDSANRAKYQRRTRFSLYLLYLASRTATFGSEMQPIFEHSSKITLFPDIPTKGTSFFISTDLKDLPPRTKIIGRTDDADITDLFFLKKNYADASYRASHDSLANQHLWHLWHLCDLITSAASTPPLPGSLTP